MTSVLKYMKEAIMLSREKASFVCKRVSTVLEEGLTYVLAAVVMERQRHSGHSGQVWVHGEKWPDGSTSELMIRYPSGQQ